MRIRQPLFLSIGIHAALIALTMGMISAVSNRIKEPEKKISLKVMVRSSEIALAPANISVEKPAVKPQTKHQEPIKQRTEPKILQPQKEPVSAKQSAEPVSAPAALSTTPVGSVENAKIILPEKSKIPSSTPSQPKMEEHYEENHLGEIRTILAQRLKYPKNARRLNQQGDVTVTFTLSQNGEVSQSIVTKSSGFEILDEAALNLILTSASEFPKPTHTVRITVPIGYNLR